MASRISLAIGIYSQVPYVIPGIEVRVYCIEELCVAFKENAVLIDEQIMNKGLTEWIYRDLGLRELADALMGMMNDKPNLGAFCRYIMEYTGLFDRPTIFEVCKMLTMGAGMSTMERQKKQADTLAENGNYEAAIHAYRNMIDKWKESESEESPAMATLLGNVYHNLGCSYAGMMKYRLAAASFKKAYSYEETYEHRHSYVAALRLSMTGTEFIKYVADHPELGPDSISLESEMDALKKEYDATGEGITHQIMKTTRQQFEGSDVSSDNEHILEALKEKYRNQMPVN
ncbi:MAG: tetratricopeptide repeat protein [Lachnospiraceae bacterium]|nr:tetratricopeptide repeat protein [Lachnospiraceae bacterium]